MRWASEALKTENIENKAPSKAEIESIFAPKPQDNHAYFSADFQKDLDAQTSSYLTAGNKVKLLPNKSSLQSKLTLIADAKKTIYVVTFHLICDKGGEEFSNALIEAAARKIDIRFLATGGIWNWRWFSGDCIKKMEKAGVQVDYTPYSYISNSGVVQLHEKMVIVDAERAVMGGQNIGSWYSDSDGKNGLFRDTDALVEGPIVNAMAKRFVKLWSTARPKDMSLIPYVELLDKKEAKASEQGLIGAKQYDDWLKPGKRSGLCRFVAQDPQDSTYYVFDAYTQLAKKAQNYVVFHVPSLNGLGSEKQEALLGSLIDVAKKPKGRVDVITNGPGFVSSKITSPRLGAIYGYYTLGAVFESVKNTPINVFGYRSWIHSKVFFFDGAAVAIGSFNFDDSGLVWTENTLICMDPGLIADSIDMLKTDFEHSVRLDPPN